MRQKSFVGRLVATVLVAVALVVASNSPIASAAASISFNISDITLSKGEARITGRFVNNSNSSVTVTAVRFRGRIDNVSVDRTFKLNFNVLPNAAPFQTFTINDSRIAPKSSGPKSTSSLEVSVSFR